MFAGVRWLHRNSVLDRWVIFPRGCAFRKGERSGRGSSQRLGLPLFLCFSYLFSFLFSSFSTGIVFIVVFYWLVLLVFWLFVFQIWLLLSRQKVTFLNIWWFFKVSSACFGVQNFSGFTPFIIWVYFVGAFKVFKCNLVLVTCLLLVSRLISTVV